MYVPRLRHQRWKRLYHRLFTQPMANNAARVIATSSIEREELKQLAPDKRLVVRANPFDFSAYRVLPPSDPIRARYQLAPAERVILFVGRISPVKNLEVLVEAFARANVPDTRLLLIGPQLEPAYTARLQRQIAGLPARERVTLGGALYGADKLALLATAELFVLPSVSENFGNAAAEAVAAGLPVLLTTTCGIAPLIDGRAGHAVEPTVAALTEGLRLMMNQTQRAQFTQQQAEVLAELSSDGPVQQMEQLYQQILLER
jgi:glycosyltransferase involved in cell wall biosynthesis